MTCRRPENSAYNPPVVPQSAPPQSRSPAVQQLLLVVTVLLAVFGAADWITHRHLPAVALFTAAAASLLLFLVRAIGRLGRLREHLGLGPPPTMPNAPDVGVPAQHAGGRHQQGGNQDRSRPRAPAPPLAIGPGQVRPIPAEQVLARQTGPGQAVGVLDQSTPRTLAGPPIFGTSSAGQAPWHLPVNAAPSGLAADAVRLGDLDVRAASMVGANHRCEEPAEPRQDAYALGRTPDGQYLVIAVADGVAASRNSDLGARVAVSASVRELTKMLASGGIPAIDPQRVHNVVAGEMIGTGRSRKLADDDVCSILITAVVPALSQPDGTRPVWASWIGDVSLWIQRDGVFCRRTGEDKSGLDRNKLTAVLPFNPDQFHQDTFQLLPGDRLAVMTDGLSDSFADVAGVAEFFADQWSGGPPHPAVFLHSLCYDAPGQGDDRTAVVVWTGAGRRSHRGELR